MTNTTTYNNPFALEGAGSAQALDYVLTPEGLIKNHTVPTQGPGHNTTPEYHYFIKDHLGNTRAVLCDMNGNSLIDPPSAGIQPEVLQVSDYYYPFGLVHDGGNAICRFIDLLIF